MNGKRCDRSPASVASFLQAGGVSSGKYTVNASYAPDNKPGSAVTVTVTIPYRPLMTFIFGAPTFNLSGSSRMYIAH